MPTNQELLGKDSTITVEDSHDDLHDDVSSGKTVRVLSFASVAVVTSIYIFLRLSHLSRYSLWYDEVFSLVVARSPWSDVFRQVILDRIHPPLFYVLLKLWIAATGTSVRDLRLFSVFFSTLALVPLWDIMRRIKLTTSLRIALLFAIACNPFLVLYSQEVRMYSLLFFLSIWSLDLYLKQESAPSWVRFAWGFVNLLLVMVHVAGIAVVGCELAHAALVRRRFGHQLLTCAPALVALFGWVIVVRAHSPQPTGVLNNVSWIPRLTIRLAWKTVAHLLGGRMAAVVLSLPLAVVFSTVRKEKHRFTSLFMLSSIVTIAFVFAFSVMIKPIWQERYLIVTVIPYYLLTGNCIRQMPGTWAKRCTLAVAAVGMLSLEYDLTHHPDRPAFARFAIPAGKPVFASDDIVGAPLAIKQRSGEIPMRVLESVSPKDHPVGLKLTVRDIAYSAGQFDIAAKRKQEIYVNDFLYAYDRGSDAFPPQGPLPTSLASYGCSEKELATTHGEGHEFVLLQIRCKS
jgi:hypothetical protein